MYLAFSIPGSWITIRTQEYKISKAANMEDLVQSLPQRHKLYIKTYGCQMNEYDSDQIFNMMNKNGFDATDSYTDADLVILNTCHIRDKATEKVYSELGRIKRAKIRMKEEQNRDMKIVVVGCVAQAEGDEVFRRSPFVDIVLGPESYHKLPEMIKNANHSKINIDFSPDEKFDELEKYCITNGKVSKFITIQEGCDKFCTFCVVPYTRGPEFSRTVEQICDEIKRSADGGTREIILLGQNVNAFHGKDARGRSWNLAQLILKISEIDGIERIRYTTSHPNEMTDELIAVHGYEKKLMPLLNLPVQSGSNKILQLMNRKYTREKYIDIINRLRKVKPGIVFSSDFIVGFPEETEDDFQETLDLIKEVIFESQCFSFKYSPRDGTGAALKSQVSEKIKSERLLRLQELLEQQQHNFNSSMLGKVVQVLLDNNNAKRNNQISGRTDSGQIAIVELSSHDLSKSKLNLNSIRSAIVTQVGNNSLICKLLEE